ncbi:acyl-CoA dehydrogenase family protein [Pollutimonas sp. M17]|uniref:acyl-CoA dehydrogenase family protein n=1 Tax=Pollutimonas sp. M17 TaxID=2962065 RepID=UPI0021F46A93|nr:acyl-CoA dehydrogenase family protein [Pollutimonas sp. M17]UYO95181.1 acyl-CoA/acyl-ACP dehydrogenase [Pollutimonas sp. M17]
MSQTDTRSSLLDAVAAQARAELAPLVQAIDQQGQYPGDYMRRLGALGGFGAAIPREFGGQGLDLTSQIEVTTLVGNECGSTAFLVWCQSSCAWYLLNSPNVAVRERYLAPVTKGELLSGTGMSNAVKHLAGIERIHLSARREGDEYVVSGSLPWVSNVGADHLVIVAASIEGEGYIMFAAHGGLPGLEQHPCPAFSGLEGTQTLNLRFKDVHIPASAVLAHPDQFPAYMKRIKGGFVLGQTGMGFGIVQASLKTIRETNVSHAHVNVFLDDQGDELAQELADLKTRTAALAQLAQEGRAPLLDVLKARAQTSELTLKAANSAVLHAGAKGYLMRHSAQRRLREAVFVAIVTPALKHLRKEIHDLEQKQAVVEAA